MGNPSHEGEGTGVVGRGLGGGEDRLAIVMAADARAHRARHEAHEGDGHEEHREGQPHQQAELELSVVVALGVDHRHAVTPKPQNPLIAKLIIMFNIHSV